MSRFLLTGASGHLGTALVKRLLANPAHRVLALVRRPASAERLAALFAGSGERLRVDVCDLAADPLALPAGERWDGLIHNAVFIPPGKDERPHLRRLYEVNALATARLLSQLTGRVGHCVLVSSLAAYGPAKGPREVLDERSPLTPTTPYGASKLGAEAIAEAWARQTRVPLMTLRSASIYGPGETQQRALPSFFQRALAGEDIYLAGFGVARRNYVYVSDAAAAVVQASERCLAGVCNLAGTPVFSLAELARQVVEVCGSRSRVWCVPGGACGDLVLDTTVAENRYQLRCATPLVAGLTRQHAWLAAERAAPRDFADFL